jgi:putative membrane protein
MSLTYIAHCFSIGAATALLAGTTALAQMTQPRSVPQAQQYPGTAPTDQDSADKAFVSRAIEGNASEVQLGQLAERKSQSKDVKQLAQKLVSDHSQMNDKWFKPVAQQLGVSEPKGPSKKDKKTMEKLENLSGSEFDNQYLTMMLKDHKQDLKQFQNEAKLAQDPNVKQVAEQGANIISQHLQMVEQVAKNHNVAAEEGVKAPSM